jgi:hypothetical protein
MREKGTSKAKRGPGREGTIYRERDWYLIIPRTEYTKDRNAQRVVDPWSM